jgi:hypothetical protein
VAHLGFRACRIACLDSGQAGPPPAFAARFSLTPRTGFHSEEFWSIDGDGRMETGVLRRKEKIEVAVEESPFLGGGGAESARR